MRDIRTEQDLKRVIGEILKGKRVKVYLFGSRAKGTNTERSDYDLAFLSEENINRELTLLREILENSNFPFFVDVVYPRWTRILKGKSSRRVYFG